MRQIWEQAIAEVIGAFALIFIGAGSVVILAINGTDPAGLLGIALAHGLVLGIMISNLGHISGGHFNPAVTVSAWVAGKIETVRAVIYVAAQLLGAIVGALLLRASLPERIWRRTSLGATLVNHSAGITNGKAVLIEAVLTFFLVLTVFAVAIDDRGVFKSLAGLPIGLVLTFDILVGGLLTGGSMNPARSFGPAIVAGKWTDFWVYLAGPLAGGIIAAALYWFAFLRGREVAGPATEMPIGGGPEEGMSSDEYGSPESEEGASEEGASEEGASEEGASEEGAPEEPAETTSGEPADGATAWSEDTTPAETVDASEGDEPSET